MSQKVGIVRFPGTNCDLDIWQAVESVESTPHWLWHGDHFEASSVDSIIIPGGFSYGDYLRCGALAAKSAVMNSVREAASRGVPVLGICNGFQILCDSGLLPGVLMRNTSGQFIDDWSEIELTSSSTSWAQDKLHTCKLPIAHGEGRYFINDDGLKKMQDQNQIWWTYKNNPNGSVGDIAGVKSEQGHVAALMPHPERALFDWMGGADGIHFFK